MNPHFPQGNVPDQPPPPQIQVHGIPQAVPNGGESSRSIRQNGSSLISALISQSPIPVSEALKRKAFLVSNLVRHLSVLQNYTEQKSIQKLQQGNLHLKKLSEEFNNAKSELVKKYHFFKRCKDKLLEGKTQAEQVLQELNEIAQSRNPEQVTLLLNDLLMPDYSWVDSILLDLQVSPESHQYWNKLRQQVEKWNFGVGLGSPSVPSSATFESQFNAHSAVVATSVSNSCTGSLPSSSMSPFPSIFSVLQEGSDQTANNSPTLSQLQQSSSSIISMLNKPPNYGVPSQIRPTTCCSTSNQIPNTENQHQQCNVNRFPFASQQFQQYQRQALVQYTQQSPCRLPGPSQQLRMQQVPTVANSEVAQRFQHDPQQRTVLRNFLQKRHEALSKEQVESIDPLAIVEVEQTSEELKQRLNRQRKRKSRISVPGSDNSVSCTAHPSSINLQRRLKRDSDEIIEIDQIDPLALNSDVNESASANTKSNCHAHLMCCFNMDPETTEPISLENDDNSPKILECSAIITPPISETSEDNDHNEKIKPGKNSKKIQLTRLSRNLKRSISTESGLQSSQQNALSELHKTIVTSLVDAGSLPPCNVSTESISHMSAYTPSILEESDQKGPIHCNIKKQKLEDPRRRNSTEGIRYTGNASAIQPLVISIPTQVTTATVTKSFIVSSKSSTAPILTSPPVLSIPEPSFTNNCGSDNATMQVGSPPAISISEPSPKTSSNNNSASLSLETLLSESLSENTYPPVVLPSVLSIITESTGQSTVNGSQQNFFPESTSASEVPVSPLHSSETNTTSENLNSDIAMHVCDSEADTSKEITVLPVLPVETSTLESPNQSNLHVLPSANFKLFQQFYIELSEDSKKVDTIFQFEEAIEKGQAYIFCDRNKNDWLVSEILNPDWEVVISCAVLESTKPAVDQESILAKFNQGTIHALILNDDQITDELKKVPLVVNFDFPLNEEAYLRRASLADTRKSASGDEEQNAVIMSYIAGKEELRLLKEIEQKYDITISRIGNESTENCS